MIVCSLVVSVNVYEAPVKNPSFDSVVIADFTVMVITEVESTVDVMVT